MKLPASCKPKASCDASTTFLIGRGKHDITGPAAEVQMLGYAKDKQVAKGIHMRLFARAFVIASPCNCKRVAFVSADLGMIFQAVKQGVIRELQSNPELKGLYSAANVIVSATHTHQGVAGYSHYALYNATGIQGRLLLQGFDEANYNTIVEGIVAAIVQAHRTLAPGRIKRNRGDLWGVSFNRSLKAFSKNPDRWQVCLQNPTCRKRCYESPACKVQRWNNKPKDPSQKWYLLPQYKACVAHCADTDKQMTLLRFEDAKQRPVGMVNWFAVHPTSYSHHHRHLNGDTKGLASYWFERRMKKTQASTPFVAAFAQANCGDVSANLWGEPDGAHDASRAHTIARRQHDKAWELFQGASTLLRGGVDYRHRLVDFSRLKVRAAYTGQGDQLTCPAALGIAFGAGSEEDGRNSTVMGKPVKEGMPLQDGKRTISFPPVSKKLLVCHREKDIFVPSGKEHVLFNPFPWTPQILPVQLVTIGSLAIAAVPFEVTTMTGRRLRRVILSALKDKGVVEVVIAGLSNAYAGYVATREAYKVQHYEGASTHFGPWTEAGLRQEFHRLALALRDNTSVTHHAYPLDLQKKQNSRSLGVVHDGTPPRTSFGQVLRQPEASYAPLRTVTATFWGAHPKNHPMTGSGFVSVLRVTKQGTEVVATDVDPNTCFSWKRIGVAASQITVHWAIPSDVPPGTYRLQLSGYYKKLGHKPRPYKGHTRNFRVTAARLPQRASAQASQDTSVAAPSKEASGLSKPAASGLSKPVGPASSSGSAASPVYVPPRDCPSLSPVTQ